MTERVPPWLQLARLRAERERTCVASLPDLGLVELRVSEWSERARAAGLEAVFDTDGRPCGPSDDETYDGVERAMRNEARLEALERFQGMRPPRSRGPLPTGNGEPPDELRRGDLGRTFGLRIQRISSDRARPLELRARLSPPIDHLWASVSWHGGTLRIHGRWQDVPEEVFDRMRVAAHRVFGDAPKLEPAPLTSRWSIESSGRCASCGREVRARLVLTGERTDGEAMHLAGVCLVCAHRDVSTELAAAVKRSGWVASDPSIVSVVRSLERPATLARCTACAAVIPRGAWRLASVLAEGALHLECAVTAEPDGFRRLLDGSTELADVDGWKARLGGR